jgi:hypothetical protein
MMLSPQAARMGTVYTTLRKIGCSAAASYSSSSSKRTTRILVNERGGGHSWWQPMITTMTPSAPHFVSARSCLVRREPSAAVAVGMSSTSWSRRTKSTAVAILKRQDIMEDDDGKDTSANNNDESSLHHPYNNNNNYNNSPGRNAADVAGAATTAPASTAKVTSDAPTSPAAAWMINLGRKNHDNEWLTGPRGREWFTGVHPRECPGMCVAFACTLRKIDDLDFGKLVVFSRLALFVLFAPDTSCPLFK